MLLMRVKHAKRSFHHVKLVMSVFRASHRVA
jgi:hypothetical protein